MAPAGDLGSGLWRGARQESISVWLVRHDRKSVEGKDLHAHPRGQDFRRGPESGSCTSSLPGRALGSVGGSGGTLQRWSDWRAGPCRCMPCLLFLCLTASLPGQSWASFLSLLNRYLSGGPIPTWCRAAHSTHSPLTLALSVPTLPGSGTRCTVLSITAPRVHVCTNGLKNGTLPPSPPTPIFKVLVRSRSRHQTGVGGMERG